MPRRAQHRLHLAASRRLFSDRRHRSRSRFLSISHRARLSRFRSFVCARDQERCRATTTTYQVLPRAYTCTHSHTRIRIALSLSPPVRTSRGFRREERCASAIYDSLVDARARESCGVVDDYEETGASTSSHGARRANPQKTNVDRVEGIKR